MRRLTLASFCALFATVLATTFGCELIATVDRSQIPGSGGAPTTSTTTSSTTSTTSGGGQGGGGAMPCTTPQDCPATTSECVLRTCDNGTCGTSNVAQGTKTTAQTAGDCKKDQCDGKGGIETVDDDSDLPNDNNDCTDDLCNAGVPSNPNKPASTACGASSTLKCDGNGQCVGCLVPADCGTDTECQQHTCTNGVCGVNNAADGTVLTAQMPGDCRQDQCDGNGGVKSVNDNSDVPNDKESCTQDLCTAGVPSNPPEKVGTACSEGTGTKCDGAGKCVECNVAADCPGADTECQQRTCTNGVCGVNNAASGTVISAQNTGDCVKIVCDGNGGTTTQNDNADLPDDKNSCTNDLCTNGTPSHTNVSNGTMCGTNLTCLNGVCSGCAAASDCPGMDDECKTRTCTAGVCGFSFTANGTAVSQQIPNDCQKKVCDGAGNVVSQADNTDLPLDDGNPCTNDTCVAGAVSHPAKANNTSCSDGNACTQNDTCQSGTCTPGAPVQCTALDSCHLAGTCDPSTGQCSNPVAPNNTPCSDGNACTQGDVCQAGACVPGTPVTCTALDSCHVAGTCNPSTGVCSNPNAPNNTPCNDGNACTQTDTCQAGVCTGSNSITCTALDSCHVAGTCNPSTGVCSNPVAPNNTPCSDGNACTTGDTCQAGTCTGTPVTCTASDQCHVAGTCDPSTGMCSNPNAPNNTPCNDGNACTQTDTCQAGVCTGTNPITCTASDQCHVAGTCDPSTGMCSNPAAPNNTPCTDGDACTTGDSCQAGSCVPGTPVTCAPLDSCHVAGTCDSSTGVCSNPTAMDGTACTSGGSPGTCQTGTCATCTDGIKNGNETGVDCGGSCPACPAVNSTTPADAATGVAISSSIAITFNTSGMNLSTLTVQTSSGACSGSVQISTDNFATCIGIGGASLAGSTLTLTPAPGLSYGSTYAVKVTSSAKDTKGNACAPYTSTTGFTTTALTASCSASVVISQVYGGGGGASATYTNDFVELHNNGGTTASIGGWSLQYQTQGSSTWTVIVTIPAGATIPPGGYYLIGLGGGTTGVALPATDTTGTQNLNATQAKVALVKSGTTLPSGCPSATAVADLVQWGSCAVACFEGTTFATAPSNNTTSATRKGLGCTDTNQNGNDFSVAAVSPRNSASVASACSCTLNESNTVLEADYCTLNTTSTLNVASGNNTGAILGELFETGVTEGGASSWIAQVGYGPDNVNPEWQSGWTWFNASYVGQTGFLNHDNQFSGSFTAPASGTYRYTYRFSSDGTNWTYCDATGAGSNASLTFEVTQLPQLIVP
jgi:hypothetical protein